MLTIYEPKFIHNKTAIIQSSYIFEAANVHIATKSHEKRTHIVVRWALRALCTLLQHRGIDPSNILNTKYIQHPNTNHREKSKLYLISPKSNGVIYNAKKSSMIVFALFINLLICTF
jgi:hypothetical protein